MKKILKNMIICIAIVYFVFSIFYNIFAKSIYTEQLQIEEATNLIYAGDTSYFSAVISIINTNLCIILGSIIIGAILGLTISLRENSKIKYILFFIFGNIIFNLVSTIILCVIFNNITQFGRLGFIKTYGETTAKTLIPYSLIYFVILYGNILINKNKVKNLNVTLNNQNNDNEDKNINKKEKVKKILKIIIPIIVVIVAIIAIVIGRRVIILRKYSKAIADAENNYYMKVETNYKQEINGETHNYNYIEEIYYKDGISLYKYNNDEVVAYSNEDNNETINVNMVRKEAITEEYMKYMSLYNWYFGSTYVSFWPNVFLAFQVKITETEYNGIECYKIERSNKDTIYIDKETYLTVGKVIKSFSYRPEEEMVFVDTNEEKYTIKPNIVTDEDIKKPDLTGIQIYTKEEMINTIS